MGPCHSGRPSEVLRGETSSEGEPGPTQGPCHSGSPQSRILQRDPSSESEAEEAQGQCHSGSSRDLLNPAELEMMAQILGPMSPRGAARMMESEGTLPPLLTDSAAPQQTPPASSSAASQPISSGREALRASAELSCACSARRACSPRVLRQDCTCECTPCLKLCRPWHISHLHSLDFVSENEDVIDEDESDFTSTCSEDTVFAHGVDERAWLDRMQVLEGRPIVPGGPSLVQDVWVEFAAREGIMIDAEELTADAKDALGFWFRQRRADARHLDDELRQQIDRMPAHVHWYHCAPPARQQPSSASSNDADAECSDAFG